MTVFECGFLHESTVSPETRSRLISPSDLPDNERA